MRAQAQCKRNATFSQTAFAPAITVHRLAKTLQETSYERARAHHMPSESTAEFPTLMRILSLSLYSIATSPGKWYILTLNTRFAPFQSSRQLVLGTLHEYTVRAPNS